MPAMPHLPDGLVAVVKKSCPTCELVVPSGVRLPEVRREHGYYGSTAPGVQVGPRGTPR